MKRRVGAFYQQITSPPHHHPTASKEMGTSDLQQRSRLLTTSVGWEVEPSAEPPDESPAWPTL